MSRARHENPVIRFPVMTTSYVRRRSIKYTYARRNKHNSESHRGRGAHDIINRLYTESVMREIAKPGIQRSARLDNGG